MPRWKPEEYIVKSDKELKYLDQCPHCFKLLRYVDGFCFCDNEYKEFTFVIPGYVQMFKVQK